MKFRYEFEMNENAYGQMCRFCPLKMIDQDYTWCAADIENAFSNDVYTHEQAEMFGFEEMGMNCPLVRVDE